MWICSICKISLGTCAPKNHRRISLHQHPSTSHFMTMSHSRRSHLMHLLVVSLLLQRCLTFSSLFFCSSPSKTSSCFAATSSSSTGHENDGVDGTTKTTTSIANQTFLQPTAQNLQTIQERQVFHKLQPSQVFCVSSPCKHGHPQA